MNRGDLYDLGVDLHEEGKFPEAINLITEGMKKYPEDIDLMLLLASCYINISQFIEATKILLKANNIKPQDPCIAYNLGYSLLCMGRITDGMKFLKECLEYKPPKKIAKMAKRMIDSEKEFREKCEDKSFLSLEEDFALYDRFLKARDYLYSKNYGEAISLYKEILIKNPNHAASIQNIGLCYFYMEKIKEAISYFEKAYDIDTSDLLSLGNLAYAYHKLRNNEKSDYYANKIVKEIKKPSLRDLVRIITIFIDIEKYDLARNLIDRYNKIKNLQLISLSGVLNAKKGNYSQALEDFESIRDESELAEEYYEKVREIIDGKIKNFNFDPMIISWDIDMI